MKLAIFLKKSLHINVHMYTHLLCHKVVTLEVVSAQDVSLLSKIKNFFITFKSGFVWWRLIHLSIKCNIGLEIQDAVEGTERSVVERSCAIVNTLAEGP